MNVIYDIAEIRLSEVHTQQVCVPRWEIPVLQVLHGDNLQVKSQRVIERAIPSPRDEFERLAKRYGPKNADVPAVGAVYGQFGPGVQALRDEMRDSLTNDDATPSTYRTIEQRKADAEKAADEGGQSLVEEAQANLATNAAIVGGMVAPDYVAAANGVAAANAVNGAGSPSGEAVAAAAAGILDAPNPGAVAAAVAAGANESTKAESGDINDLI